jgi:membrane-associated phospholipid phosphatase
MIIRVALGLGLALVATASASARADEIGSLQMRSMSGNAAITSAAATSWLTLELFRGRFLDDSCRWCDTAPDGADALNRFDRGMRKRLVWGNVERAHLGSNIALYGGSMMSMMGLGAISAVAEGRSANIGEDYMIMAQSTFMALAVNNVAKIAFQRQRPYAHAAAMSEDGLSSDSESDNLSFFSGHTTLAFSMAVSAGTIASMRNYKLAPVIWGVGLTSAAATGYLRIAADKHYLSDVLVGAAVGSLFGFGVPYLLHGKCSGENDIALTGGPIEGGGVISFSGVW